MEYSQGNKLDFTKYEELLKSRAAQFTEKTCGKKVDYSYQELGIEMQQWFGKNIWYLFFKYKESDIRYAFDICKRKDVHKLPYLIGCIKHKYNGF